MGNGRVQVLLRRVAIGTCLSAVTALSMGAVAAARADGPKVVVTIKPVHSLVAQVMEGLGSPALLIDGQASPHAYALRPSDARALNEADVVVRVAPAVEPFTIKIANALPSGTMLVTLADAPGLELLNVRAGVRFEQHEHGEGHDHDKDHDRDEAKAASGENHKHDEGSAAHGHEAKDAHGHNDEHDHDAGGVDGHIWLDPGNAKAIVQHVAKVLADRYPALKDKLEANVAKAVAGIDALDADLRAAVAPAVGKPFIVFHDAYQYFERHYGLQAAGAITLNPEVKPSARRLSEIRNTLETTGAACVFAEPQFSPRIVASVIEGSKAKAGTVDPLGFSTPAGPGQYAVMMRNLAAAMAACLGG